MTNDQKELLRAFKGNQAAVDLALMIARVSHIWDDLIDQDKPVSEADVHDAFWITMFGIPDNVFYQAFGHLLRPAMMAASLDWAAANTLEKRQDLHGLQIAHVARYSIANVIILMATIIGGREWGFAVAGDLRLLCQKNLLSDYLKEHGHEA